MRFDRRAVIYSFVLTIFVIWLHAGESLLSSIPGQTAVPGFFLISGYLFTRSLSGGGGESSSKDLKLIKEKLKRRVKTLLVPYLLWNTLYFIIYLCFGRAQLSDAFLAVFHYKYNPVFWYLFQLMLITVLMPLLYFALKGKITGIVFLAAFFAAAVFCGRFPFHYCNEDALFYYSLGAFSGLCFKEEFEKTRNAKALIIAVCLFAAFSALKGILPAGVINAGTVGQRASGAVLLWTLTGFLPDFSPAPFTRVNFFIYAVHYLLIRLFWVAAGSLRDSTLLYVLMPLLCTAFSYGIYSLMKKYMPRILGILVGGR